MIHNKFCDSLHAEKYRQPGEDFRSACNRQASALNDSPEHFAAFKQILTSLRFMPAGRVQAAAGAPRQVTAFNCFVMPTIEDSFVEGTNSIMDIASQAAQTMRMGGGVGYDWSTLRPKGDVIAKLGSRSSGPVAFMQINDAVCRATASAGNRRGAQMGVMRIDHPDIQEFIRAKQPPPEAEVILEQMDSLDPTSEQWGRLNDVLQRMLPLSGFNVSIAVTDQFMDHLETGQQFPLKWKGRTYSYVDPRALWEEIMRATWDWAEPGVLFIDTINRMNNLWYCETIAATNPCGEQPLPPSGACLLGSFNLVRYLVPSGAGGWEFDFEQLRRDIPHVVRAMDNVVDRTIYPTYEQEKEAKAKRRMGLGVTGAANAIEAIGEPYGTPGFCRVLEEILTVLRDEAYMASAELAREKGAFEKFDEEMYLSGEFAQTLPNDVRDLIRECGIRNSHLLSEAPTGTISLCADNVSSGIEPVFAYGYDRTVDLGRGKEAVRVNDYGVEHLKVRGKQAADVTVTEHLNVLEVTQRFMDSAVSKTCNVPPNTPWEEFKDIYVQAWKRGAKGCTTFTTGGRRFGVLNVNEDVEDSPAQSCEIDAATGRRSCE